VAIRLLINDDIAYEGPDIPVPRVGDHLNHDGEVVQIHAVTWDLGDANVVVVSLGVGTQPYTY
jgi:hypothetical protein